MKRTLFFIALALASACGMSSYHANITETEDSSEASDAATSTDVEKTVQSFDSVDADSFSQASIY